MTWTDPSFPPLLTGRCVVEGTDPTTEAVHGAASGELGAGDTLWARDTSTVRLALVLEPDEPLQQSAQVLLLATVAAGDCVGALTPPQVGVQFRWPATVLINGANAGALRLCASTAEPSAVPEWLVLTLDLRFAFDGDHEPGSMPGITALTEEGVEELTTTDILESYSRHFLTWLNRWQSEGLRPIEKEWSARAEGRDETANIQGKAATVEARVLGLDEDGNLLIKQENAAATTLQLLDAVTVADAAANTTQ